MQHTVWIWVIAFGLIVPLRIAHPQSTSTNATVLLHYTNRQVENIEVYARFMTGKELGELQKLLGVTEDVLQKESAYEYAEQELFLVMRAKASPHARGVPYLVKLQLANDSPLVREMPLIEFSPMFQGELQMQIIKIQSLDYNGDKNDLFSKLHKEKPIFRLRSMMLK
jgi:hypothetical protein